MIWSLVQSVGGQAVVMLVYLLLAVVLTPADFGLVGIATVWTAVLSAFAETGFGAALIQRAAIDDEHASTTFLINVGVGLVLAIVGAGIALPVAAWFGDDRIAPVLAVLSAGFVLRALGLTHAALAQRHLRFRGLAVRDIAANTAAGLVGLGLALAGAGVWSLVSVSLVSAAVGSALMWRIDPWRPSMRRVSREAMRDLWRFSSSILGFNIFKAVVQNVDRLIVGHMLGTSAVGFYALASRLAIQPPAVPVGALGVYLFPRVARHQHDLNTAREDYAKVLSLCFAIAVPYAILVACLAGTVVPRAFGREWLPAVPVVWWLSVAAIVRAMFSPATQLMKALGRPDLMLRWSVAITALTAIALFAGSAWGLTGVAASFAAAHVVGIPVIIRMVGGLAGVGFAQHARAVGSAVGTGAILAAALSMLFMRVPDRPVLRIVTTLMAVSVLGAWLLARERAVAGAVRALLRRNAPPEPNQEALRP